ncbi:DinB family protein [Arthrobacter sp. MYb227]|uniref:DinB family protein n=1 Tax=Arthrobacter sp. MYb227 TaxID=1848601 RepID=UPI001C61451C|nr:DinB family protein [Arthrobacter sp. MYb227]
MGTPMYARDEVDPRTNPPPCGSERETLLGFLTYQRQTFAAKCAGLTDAQLATRSVPPSAMSLLGLLRHLSDVERFWVRIHLLGQSKKQLYWHADGNDTDFEFPYNQTELVPKSWRVWHKETAFSDAALSQESMEATVHITGHGEVSVRWILTHLIEEYSRHNGHADLLRECLDGVVGE